MALKSDNLNAIAADAGDELLVLLTEYLRTIAYRSGWPANYINGMKVSMTDDFTIYVDPNPDLQEDIDDLEYGNLNALPNAAIRPFILRASDVIEQLIEEKALPRLFAELGVL
jgi:hypothetical protein